MTWLLYCTGAATVCAELYHTVRHSARVYYIHPDILQTLAYALQIQVSVRLCGTVWCRAVFHGLRDAWYHALSEGTPVKTNLMLVLFCAVWLGDANLFWRFLHFLCPL